MVQEVVRIHLTQELTSLAVVVHNGGGLGREEHRKSGMQT